MTTQILSPQTLAGERRIDAPQYAAWYGQSIDDPEAFWRDHGRRIAWLYDGTLNAASMIPAPAMRIPIGRLSCPYSRADVRPYQQAQPHRSFRAFGPRCKDATNPWNARDVLTTDYWNPPTCARQHARQRALAIVLAFILAALAAQAGW